MIWAKLYWWKRCESLRWLWRVLVTWGFSVPGGVDGNQGTGSPAKYSQLFEMEIRLFQFRNQIKANIQGVSRLCSCPFEVAAKGGMLQPGWSRISLSLFSTLLSTCWLGVVSPKQSAPPPTPHDSLSWYRWTGDWFKMTVSSSCRKRRLIQRNSQASFLSL